MPSLDNLERELGNEQILTEERGRVGIITLNRPEKLNAMTGTTHRQLRERIQAWNGEDGIGAVVITGAGRAFCAGADVGRFEEGVAGSAGTEEPRPPESEWIELIKGSKPVVCAINGIAVGEGITMTLPCDVRVAAQEARVSFRFIRMGLTPEFGSSHYLAQLVGLGQAMELMLTGRMMEAEEAQKIGLVNHVYPGDRMLDEAVALAQEIAENPDWHLRRIKRLIHESYLNRDTAEVLSWEDEANAEAMAGEAHREALEAFREKRRPRFHVL